MAVKEISGVRHFTGLSSDTKPTDDVPAGSTFMEYTAATGQGQLYSYTGAAWARRGDAVTVTADTELSAAAVLADATANPTTSNIGSMTFLWNGATWDRAPGTAANGIKVQPATGGTGVDAATVPRVTLATNVGLPAGTALIGKVGTDQTTHGTTDLVASDITKIAGAATPVGHGVAATALRVELPTDGTGTVGLIAGSATIGTVSLTDISAAEYETVAASQTAQALGATGATGDYLAGVLVIPATTSPGLVTILDNATSIPVFVGGASSVSNLVPFFIPLGIKSVSGAWKITTGASVSVIGVGNFS